MIAAAEAVVVVVVGLLTERSSVYATYRRCQSIGIRWAEYDDIRKRNWKKMSKELIMAWQKCPCSDSWKPEKLSVRILGNQSKIRNKDFQKASRQPYNLKAVSEWKDIKRSIKTRTRIVRKKSSRRRWGGGGREKERNFSFLWRIHKVTSTLLSADKISFLPCDGGLNG